jgi:hypothetical protein
MPGGDRTGPWGAGPMTGRGRGYCSGYAAPGYMYPGPGLGYGRGFGRGFGRGMGYGRGRGWGMGYGRGRGWGMGGFGPYWQYPPMMPYGHPYGMPYGYPPAYGYPYGPGYEMDYPEPEPVKKSTQGKK